jgi:hypothetical protein
MENLSTQAQIVIDRIELIQVKSQFERGNVSLNAYHYERFAFLSNGAKMRIRAMYSEIGNNGLDSWANIMKMQRSTSDKNIHKYLSKFIDIIYRP